MAEVLEEKIQALLARRTELVDRLENLEALKADTNDRVYRKIKGDYASQLNDVLSGISDQRGTLESKVQDLTSQIEEKENTHTKQSDQVDELQIRARLREFDENDNSFQNELEEAKAGRNEIADQLDRLRRELADLNKVLRDVDSATDRETGTIDADELDELDLDEDTESIGESGEEGGIACPSCGHQNPPQKLFCEECGAALDDDSEIDDEFDLIDDDLDL